MIFSISLITLALCACANAAPSEHLQHIPVPGYHPKLQFLGQHVDLPEVPTKVIRITKTVAIKVPVPYPVKIPHNIPYPVHINKPYPVPVPQIIKVPQPVPVPVHSSGAHGLPAGDQDNSLGGGGSFNYQPQIGSYNTEEESHDDLGNGGFSSHGNQESSNGGSEHYAESQQSVSPAIYQHVSLPMSYRQGQDFLNYGQNAYSGTGNAAESYQKLSQDAFYPKAEASQYYQANAYQQGGQGYQVEAPVQSAQQNSYGNDGYSH